MNCKECGAELLEGAQFCSNCGARIARPAMPAASKRSARRRRLALAAGVGALAMATGVVVVALLVVQPFGGDQEWTPDNGVTALTGFPDASPTVGPLEQEDQPHTPFERLLSYVPADLSTPESYDVPNWRCLVDWDGFFKAYGYSGVLGLDGLRRLPDEELKSLMMKQASIAPANRHGGVPVGDPDDYRSLLGFDPSTTTQTLQSAGAMGGYSPNVWLGEFDVQRTTQALTDAGYKPREEDGVGFLSYADAWEVKRDESGRIIDHPRPRFNQIWPSSRTLVVAADPEELADAVRAGQGDIPSAYDRPEYRLILGEMAPSLSLCLTRNSVGYFGPSLVERWAWSMQTGPSDQEHEEAIRLVLAGLRDDYPGWGVLSEPVVLVLGYDYSPLQGDTFKVGLWYEDAGRATTAAEEIRTRLSQYRSQRTYEQFCDSVSVGLADGLVVAECSGGMAAKWIDAWERIDLLFLIDDLRGSAAD